MSCLGSGAVFPRAPVRYRWGKARRGVKPGQRTKGRMARGFWTGLVHGTVISGAALAALSLAVPLAQRVEVQMPPVGDAEAQSDMPAQPSRPVPDSVTSAADDAAIAAPAANAPDPESAPSDPAPVIAAAPIPEPAASAAPEAATTPEAASDTPQATALDLPVGSEFGRGGDVVPRLPDPLQPVESRFGQSEAPAVSAPAAEPAPVALTDPAARPDTDAPIRELSLSAPPMQTEEQPQFDRPAVIGAPVAALLPGMAQTGSPDDLPAAPLALPDETPALPAAAPAGDNAAEDPAELAVEVAPPAVPAAPISNDTPAVTATPSLPSPGPDLSMPPDLSDLRGLQRN